jgi:hypothetical protein
VPASWSIFADSSKDTTVHAQEDGRATEPFRFAGHCVPARIVEAASFLTLTFLFADPLLVNYRGQIGVTVVTDRLPTISAPREYADAGLLLTYDANLQDLFRRVRGGKPG